MCVQKDQHLHIHTCVHELEEDKFCIFNFDVHVKSLSTRYF